MGQPTQTQAAAGRGLTGTNTPIYGQGQGAGYVNPATGAIEPPYVAGISGGMGNLNFEQFPLGYYGFPGMDAMMQSLGFVRRQDRQGRWYWDTSNVNLNADPQYVNQMMASQRDVLEPDVLRMLGQGQSALASRGMESSSIATGLEGGLRGEFLKNLSQQRMDLIQKERQRKWQQILDLIASAQGQASAAAQARKPTEPEEEGTDWLQVGLALAGLFAKSQGVPA